MKKLVTENITKALLELNYPSDKLNVQKTTNSKHGDYTVNIAMILSKELKKTPTIIAENIISTIKQLYPENFSSIEIADPGFINFKIEKTLLFKQLN